jgi:hypothetical protein
MSGSCDSAKLCTDPELVVSTRRISDGDDPQLDVIFQIDTGGAPVPAAGLVLFYFYSSEPEELQVHHATVDPGSLSEAEIYPEYLEFGPSGSNQWALKVSFGGEATWDTSSGEIHLQGRTQSSAYYIEENDFSWPADIGDFGDELQRNSRTVLCQQVADEWHQVWGNSHPEFPAPCSTLVEAEAPEG